MLHNVSIKAENSELRAELRASNDVINQLKDQLAQMRLSQQQVAFNGDGNSSHEDTPPESQNSQVMSVIIMPYYYYV